MKHLVLNSFGLFLGLKSQRLVVYKNREIIKEIALKSLKTISINSNGINISSDLVFACSIRGIKIFYANFTNFSATHTLYEHKGVNVLKEQFASATNGKDIILAKELIIGKIKNQRSTILYFSRNFTAKQKENILASFQKALQILKNKNLNKDEIFGIEGSVANAYFEYLKQNGLFADSFEIRTKRNSTEITNQALNYGYAILLNFVYKSIINAGLNPYFGVLHSMRSSKPSLALDIMEEYRSFVVDRNIIKLRSSLKNSLEQDDKRLIASNILNTMRKKLIYNHRKLTLESIIQRQIYKISAFFCDNKKYKSYIFRW
ncbi:CRISPR/Cas system-associated endonuclease Cas1, type II-B/NMENI [Campylobacter lanienae NCTC 13004]|uniref:CRISPR-associated endonuclease Cas1 n=1 Tax=Campylobacter lanienae NCTC 13004 TaxID=1031753 RepID=A0A1X9SLE2_9BACT|nr:CRISPR-associated endonuclease Cas1 [Campylobacter lanienae]ARQ97039.1 CRISPR/Cas system-associated endonuclease Cas1, type II-B/NMENI [Campylobacter lanienae NCTC 13004]